MILKKRTSFRDCISLDPIERPSVSIICQANREMSSVMGVDLSARKNEDHPLLKAKLVYFFYEAISKTLPQHLAGYFERISARNGVALVDSRNQ